MEPDRVIIPIIKAWFVIDHLENILQVF